MRSSFVVIALFAITQHKPHSKYASQQKEQGLNFPLTYGVCDKIDNFALNSSFSFKENFYRQFYGWEISNAFSFNGIQI